MNASKIRTFIAIRLPHSVLKALGTLSVEVARPWPDRSVRWVRPEEVHLTLRFLGDTGQEQVAAVRAALDQVAARTAPFELRLEGMGCFPNPRRPQVIWVGVEDPGKQLAKLQKAVEHSLRPLGWEREARRFVPHLTLGRVRERQRPPHGEWMQNPPLLAFQVEAVELIESRLKPTGAEYSTLHRATLVVDQINLAG